MEYERHANRLVLGFLKNNCSSAYKAFLKHTFQNQGKHINTRIAGQNLEDILRIYSRISEIVQGRIEDTNYPVEHGSEKLSPMFLAEQLLYLLDHCQIKQFPRSRRTSTESSVAESHRVEDEEYAGHGSDVETTPENSLPGNVNYYSSSKKTCSERNMLSSRRKPARVEKVVMDKEALSEAMSEKLLQNREFQHKLASTITTVLNTPDVHATKYSHNATFELDSTIKNVLNKTEADPMFEDVLREFLGGPGVNSGTKQPLDTLSTTSSDHHVREKISTPAYSSAHTDRGSESSDLNETCKQRPPSKNNSVTNEEPVANLPNSETNEELVENLPERPGPVITPNVLNTPLTSYCSMVSQSISAPTNPIYINSAPGGLFVVPQPYYVINQPITIPSNSTTNYQQPTTFDSCVSNSQAEANNIQEYLAMYDDAKPSPLVKQQPQQERRGLKKVIYPRKSGKFAPLQARPTVKVEIVHVNEGRPVQSTQDPSCPINVNSKSLNENRTVQSRQTNSCSRIDNNMPSVNFEPDQDIFLNAAESNLSSNKTQENSNIESESNKASAQKEILSGPRLITPSPSITAVQKRTPKSGSHIRNLTFPSPTKESRMSQSSDAKLCSENNDDNKPSGTSVPICWDARLRKFIDPVIPEKNKRRKTPRKITKSKELNVTAIEGKLLEQALNTPKDTKKCSKRKTLQAKKTAETQIKDSENTKKILSPSKLNASKRNLLYEAENENEMQNKDFLQEETPLKNFPITPGIKGETPFTPMLQANLKEITGGDIFCIDTPNFPITPGLSFMANSTNYYIFQDDEKVLTGEKKKSDEKSPEIFSNNGNTVKPSDKTVAENIKENTGDKKRKISDEATKNKVKKPRLSPKKKQNSKTSKDCAQKPSPKKDAKNSPKSPSKTKKKLKPVENGDVKKRQTRSTVLSKLKNNKPSNSPRNDSDDQCNFFKASGTNLKKKKETKKQEGTSMDPNTVIEKLPQSIIDAASKEADLHMALLYARQEFTICHFNKESQTYTHNETTRKINLSYDASILDKKRKVTVFTAQDDEIKIILSATKFIPLLDIEERNLTNGESETLPKERKENVSGEPKEVTNAKRRSRSDSNSSYNSTCSKKKEPVLPENTEILKDVNIKSFLTQIHGNS